jgi:hypothetical protein
MINIYTKIVGLHLTAWRLSRAGACLQGMRIIEKVEPWCVKQ